MSDIEKQEYIEFHSRLYKEDIEEALTTKNSRWKVIAGYYAMHNITKLLLAKLANIKIKPPEVHKKTIEAFSLLKISENKKLFEMMKGATEFVEKFGYVSDELLLGLLYEAKEERTKSQN